MNWNVSGYKAMCASVGCPNDGQPVICSPCAKKAAEAAKAPVEAEPVLSWRDKPPLL